MCPPAILDVLWARLAIRHTCLDALMLFNKFIVMKEKTIHLSIVNMSPMPFNRKLIGDLSVVRFILLAF